jgi:hypothetical protein
MALTGHKGFLEFLLNGETLRRGVIDVLEFQYEYDKPSLDATGIGEAYKEVVASLITGTGTIDFIYNKNLTPESTSIDTISIIELALATQSPANTFTAFLQVVDKTFIKTDVIFSRANVRAPADNIIEGSGNIVSVSPILFSENESFVYFTGAVTTTVSGGWSAVSPDAVASYSGSQAQSAAAADWTIPVGQWVGLPRFTTQATWTASST